MTGKQPPYSRYAEVYDSLGQSATGAALARETLAFLDRLGFQPNRVVDLACGTGAATLEFAGAGLSAIGVDSSGSMLDKARQNAAARSLTIDWIRGDMRDPVIRPVADLVTCFFDAVNYLLTPADLRRFLIAARFMMSDDGWLVFDVNTRKRMEEGWGDACFVAVDRDDLFGVYRSWFDPVSELSPLHLTFFHRQQQDIWQRYDEEHVERGYPLALIDSELSEAGLSIFDRRQFDDRVGKIAGPGSEESYRVVWFARKRN